MQADAQIDATRIRRATPPGPRSADDIAAPFDARIQARWSLGEPGKKFLPEFVADITPAGIDRLLDMLFPARTYRL
jgi:hypothetical protein